MSFLLHNQTRNTDLGLLILRIIGGAFMMVHGYPKLMKILNGDLTFGDPIGVGQELSLILVVFAEFVCAFLILIGFKVRLATIPLMFTMLVAAFIAHGDDPWNRKELALVFFFIYLALFFMGGGKHSLDERL